MAALRKINSGEDGAKTETGRAIRELLQMPKEECLDEAVNVSIRLIAVAMEIFDRR